MARRKSVTAKPAGKKPAKTKSKKVDLSKLNKANQTAIMRELRPVAKQINAMIEQSTKADTRSFDLRLSAAVTLATARKTCTKGKVNFKAWSEANITIGYKEVKRLALVGESDNPQLALEDMRASTARRVAAHKERSTTPAATTSAPRVTHATEPKKSAYVAALDHAQSLNEDEQIKIAGELAAGVGLVTATKDRLPFEATVEMAHTMLKRISPGERRKVLRWLTELVEEDAAAAGIEAATGDNIERPAFLDRGVVKKPAKKRATAMRKAAKRKTK